MLNDVVYRHSPPRMGWEGDAEESPSLRPSLSLPDPELRGFIISKREKGRVPPGSSTSLNIWPMSLDPIQRQ
jgi:hypothetical protein